MFGISPERSGGFGSNGVRSTIGNRPERYGSFGGLGSNGVRSTIGNRPETSGSFGSNGVRSIFGISPERSGLPSKFPGSGSDSGEGDSKGSSLIHSTYD